MSEFNVGFDVVFMKLKVEKKGEVFFDLGVEMDRVINFFRVRE